MLILQFQFQFTLSLTSFDDPVDMESHFRIDIQPMQPNEPLLACPCSLVQKRCSINLQHNLAILGLKGWMPLFPLNLFL